MEYAKRQIPIPMRDPVSELSAFLASSVHGLVTIINPFQITKMKQIIPIESQR